MSTTMMVTIDDDGDNDGDDDDDVAIARLAHHMTYTDTYHSSLNPRIVFNIRKHGARR